MNQNELTSRIINIDMLANKSHAEIIRQRGCQTVQDEPDPGYHLSSSCSNDRLEEQGGNSMSLIILTRVCSKTGMFGKVLGTNLEEWYLSIPPK